MFTILVAVDRRYDRNCDIGRFELAYKQPLVTVPPYIGISLIAEGATVRKPPGFIRRSVDGDSNQFFSPRKQTNENKDSNKSFGHTGVNKRPQSENNDSSANHKHLTVSSAPAKTHTKINSACEPSTVYLAARNQRKIIHKNNATNVQTRKSPSANNAHASSSNSSSNQSDSGEGLLGAASDKENNHPTIMTGFPKPEKSVSLPTNGFMASLVPSKRIISRTSVSANYSIPLDKQERAILAVNNVESTDLQTIIQPKPPSAANSSTKGNGEVHAIYKLAGFPAKTATRSRHGRRVHVHSRPLGSHYCIKKQKDYAKRPEVLIKFPKVPYASVNVSFGELDIGTPKLKYCTTLDKDDRHTFHPGASVVPSI